MSNAVPQANTRTNTLAAIALVLGFVFPLLAIPVGHVARRQIARTGERGDALALIGLIFGYFWLIASHCASDWHRRSCSPSRFDLTTPHGKLTPPLNRHRDPLAPYTPIRQNPTPVDRIADLPGTTRHNPRHSAPATPHCASVWKSSPPATANRPRTGPTRPGAHQ